MKKLVGIALIAVLAVCLAFPHAFAANAKYSAQVSGDLATAWWGAELSTVDTNTIFSQEIRTASQKDLLVTVSLECGLVTNTSVASKKLDRALANATAAIEVEVLVDGEPALPGRVTFNRRSQDLIAWFAGDIYDCFYTDEVTGALMMKTDDSCIQEEGVQLILDTMSAHSFSFVVTDLTSGDHTVTVKAYLSYMNEVDGEPVDPASYKPAEVGTFGVSAAVLGNGSVTIDEVQMIKGEDVIIE